jgi:hypothetical protein
MGGDERGGSIDALHRMFDLDAPAAEFGQDGFVVNQLSQNGERRFVCFIQGEADGIANAKAHA